MATANLDSWNYPEVNINIIYVITFLDSRVALFSWSLAHSSERMGAGRDALWWVGSVLHSDAVS